MASSTNAQLDVPRTPFPFPYNPYPIQHGLMSNIYTTIKRSNVGIFESPTGTGKTLSIICSAMHWLREYQEHGSDDEEPDSRNKPAEGFDDDEPDWCRTFESDKATREAAAELQRRKGVRAGLTARLSALRSEDVNNGDALSAVRAERRRKRQAPLGGVSGGHQQAGGKRHREGDAGEGRRKHLGQDDGADSRRRQARGDDVEDFVPSDFSDSETEAMDVAAGRTRDVKGGGTAHRKHAGRVNATALGVSEAAARSMGIADAIRADMVAQAREQARAGQDAERQRTERRRGARAGEWEATAWEQDEELERATYHPQILYVSRTHSQVAQFVREINKTAFGGDARVVALGSRKSLCVHPQVSALASDSRINEQCLEMQDAARRHTSTSNGTHSLHASSTGVTTTTAAVGDGAGASSASGVGVTVGASAAAVQLALWSEAAKAAVDSLKAIHSRPDPAATHTGPGCPYLAEPEAQDAYRDVLLARVRDIEDAGGLGWQLRTCAYYGSRRAVKYAEVVAMPYSMLLHAATRASSGVDLHGAVVIIDEAHNIIDAINSAHASSVTADQLSAAHRAVRAYLDKYEGRMKASNVQLCKDLAQAIAGLLGYIAGQDAAASSLPAVAADAVIYQDTAMKGLYRGPPIEGEAGSVVPALTTYACADKRGDLAPSSAPPIRSVSPIAVFFGAGKLKPVHSDAAMQAPPQLVLTACSSAGSSSSASLLVPVAVRPDSSAAPAVSTASEGVGPPLQQAAPSRPHVQRAPPGEKLHTISGLLSVAQLEGVNLFRVRKYVEAVDLLKKLRGFAESVSRTASAQAMAQVTIHTEKPGKGQWQGVGAGAGQPGTAASYMASVTAVQQVWSFLMCLLFSDGDGRIISNVPLSSAEGGGGGVVMQDRDRNVAPSLRFMLLNPSLPFREVVNKARSVILVGGTMQPVSDIVDQLFSHVPARKLTTFGCGHIIPRDNLNCLIISAGPSAVPFDFRHASRREPRMMDELGRALISLCTLVPGGVVVFLPSFDYEAQLMAHWAKAQAGAAGAGAGAGDAGSNRAKTAVAAAQNLSLSGQARFNPAAVGSGVPTAAPGSILDQLQKRKKVFREPRGAGQVDAILSAYCSAIRGAPPAATASAGARSVTRDDDSASEGAMTDSDTESVARRSVTSMVSGAFTVEGGVAATASAGTASGGGAILFSVIGGKMSEGINFADDMARCVVVAGLPYPNPQDPELRERMEYLNRLGPRACAGPAPAPSQQGQTSRGAEYYENLCMRAVNQSIGRSIRHARDYAVICLLDGRYAQARIRAKLPGWIGDRLTDCPTWGPVVAATANFFRRKRAQAAGAASQAPGVT